MVSNSAISSAPDNAGGQFQEVGMNLLCDDVNKQLILSNTIKKNLNRVYSSLKGSEANLRADVLQKWLHEIQVAPKEKPVKTEYNFQDWLDMLYTNRLLEAQKVSKPKDLTKPISNYYISSSHNTYLSGNQIISKSSTKEYKNVLCRGCRCIEVDVHNSPSPKEEIAATSDDFYNEINTLENSETTVSASGSGSWLPIFSPKAKKSENNPELDLPPDAKNSSSHVSHSESSPSETKIIPGEPVVKHGWTLTSSVGFRAVCKTIAKEAFKLSQLPIIVSLEVHADLEQQEVMVKIMKEEWGDALIQAPMNDCNPKERLPRLEEVMGKILIKVKRPSLKIPKIVSQREVDNSSDDSKKTSDSRRSSSSSDSDKKSEKIAAKVKISESLGNLGIYTYTERFKGFETIMEPTHIFSLKESDLINLSKNQNGHEANPVFTHNRNFIMRTYPRGIRINSSNPSPIFFWPQGTQIVAMNWQKIDDGMMLNEAMFFGEDGWALKPAGFRSDTSEVINYTNTHLKIKLVAGQLPSFPGGKTSEESWSRIQCELHAETENEPGADEGNNSEAKGELSDIKGHEFDFGSNGSCLLRFQSKGRILEELSFVKFRVEVWGYIQYSLVAWAYIRLDRLQSGYRLVHLLDMKANTTLGTLLIKVKKATIKIFNDIK